MAFDYREIVGSTSTQRIEIETLKSSELESAEYFLFGGPEQSANHECWIVFQCQVVHQRCNLYRG